MKPNKTNRLRETNNPRAYEALLHGAKCEREGDLIRAECWYKIASREGSIQGHASLKRLQNKRIPNSITARDTIEYQRNLNRANSIDKKEKIAPSLSIPKEEERILVENLSPGQASKFKQPHGPNQPAGKTDNQSAVPPKKTSKISTLEKQAENGDLNAQFELGHYYEKKGKKQQAHKWYKKAAEQGHADAKFRLGVLHLEIAIRYMQNAASQNHAQAAQELERLTKPVEMSIPIGALQHIWLHDTEEDEQFSVSRINRQTHKTGIGYPAGTSYQAQDFSAYEMVAGKEAQGQKEENKKENAGLLRVWMELHSSMESCEDTNIADGITGNQGNDTDSGIWRMKEEEKCAETESSGHVQVDGEQHNFDMKEASPVSGCICCRLIQRLKTIFSIK